MFRYSHSATVNASDVRVLMGIEKEQLLSEGGTGVVFVAREVTDQLVKWTAPVKPAVVGRTRRVQTSDGSQAWRRRS